MGIGRRGSCLLWWGVRRMSELARVEGSKDIIGGIYSQLIFSIVSLSPSSCITRPTLCTLIVHQSSHVQRKDGSCAVREERAAVVR